MTEPSDINAFLGACAVAGVQKVGADGAAVFSDPWHAQAVALTLSLSQAGFFNWSEWVGVFSRQIAGSPQTPAEDADAAYYRQWLGALEVILATKHLISEPQLAAVQEDWRRSFLHTEHGQPVVFQRGLPLPDTHDQHNHAHDHSGGSRDRAGYGLAQRIGPVAVSHASAIR